MAGSSNHFSDFGTSTNKRAPPPMVMSRLIKQNTKHKIQRDINEFKASLSHLNVAVNGINTLNAIPNEDDE